jgi:hypothetical protein
MGRVVKGTESWGIGDQTTEGPLYV